MIKYFLYIIRDRVVTLGDEVVTELVQVFALLKSKVVLT